MSSLSRLDNHVALVTGGASGIGHAIATRLAADGASVVISDVDSKRGQQVAREHGFTFVCHDVGNETQWIDVIAQIERAFGNLHILVNNAGVLGPMNTSSPENTALSDWKRVFMVNVEGVFLGCRTAIPAMRRSGFGSIINISSVAGLLATPFATAYGASKATVRQLTKSVAQHCAQEKLNVRCNSVHPGNVRTSLWDIQAIESAAMRGVSLEQVIAEGRAEAPMGDFTLPEDVAAACSFLASNDARYITGAKLVVDGGLVNCDTFHLMARSIAGNFSHS